MKLSVLLIALGLGVSSTSWAEEECEFAVDMSDSHDFEDFHNCEQSTSGLNHLLKGLVDREEPSPLQTTSEAPAPRLTPLKGALKPAKPERKNAILLGHQTPDSLDAQRSELFAQMAEACPQGFSIEAEEYRPHASAAFLLTYQYRCL